MKNDGFFVWRVFCRRYKRRFSYFGFRDGFSGQGFKVRGTLPAASGGTMGEFWIVKIFRGCSRCYGLCFFDKSNSSGRRRGGLATIGFFFVFFFFFCLLGLAIGGSTEGSVLMFNPIIEDSTVY